MDTVTTETQRWDLSRIYQSPSDPAIEADMAECRQVATAFRDRHRGRLAALDATEMRRALETQEGLKARLTMLQIYASLLFWADTRQEAAKILYDRVRTETAAVENDLKFFKVELHQLPSERLQALRADEALAPYRYYMARLEAQAPHMRSEAEERVLAIKDMTGAQAWIQLQTEITAGIKVHVEAPDGRREVTGAEARSMRTDPDRRIREAATVALLQAHADRAPMLVPIYNALYEDHHQTCRLRGYDDPMAPTLLGEDIGRPVVDALLCAVEANYGLAQRYYRLKAKLLGIEDFQSHDMYAPYPAGGRHVPFEEARRLVLDAYESFSPEAAERVRGFFDGRYIDVPPAPGKQGGAFCANMVPGEHPFVLLNYTHQLTDVMTIAHELGHGLHALLSGERNSLFNYYSVTPLMETASTFMELHTVNRLLSQEHDPQIRRQLMASRIEYAMFIIFLQVLNTRWELRAHAARAEGRVSAEDFCRIWREENQKLYGDAVGMGEWESWRWMIIPHLVQFRFYCYSYAFGQLLVYALYQQYQEEGEAFVPKFLDVLAAGGSAPPAEILGRLGVEIEDPAFWQKGLTLLEGMIDEFEASLA